ncbi:MAG TPA: MBL fold metallo-hydrolase [Terriglobales bacterium]|jgi:L-ascorbate 6-phosphate lactonase|nr:MBL fold metallo-hydrolase [Terriglobales bacterium]
MRDTSFWPKDFLAEIEAAKPVKGISLWSLGSPSFLFRSPECTIYIDPYFGPTPPEAATLYPGVYRSTAVPIYPPEITVADVLISTHDHTDHCYEPTLQAFQTHTDVKFLAPDSSAQRMEKCGVQSGRIVRVSPGDKFDIKDVKIQVLESNDPDAPGAVTFILSAEGVNLFVSGDTRDGKILSKIGREHNIDVALLAFGGTRWYMTHEQLLAAARRLNPKLLLPFHWEVWRGQTGNPLALGKLLVMDPPEFDVRLLQIGDSINYEAKIGIRE